MKWTTMKIYFYLCMYVLREKPLMYMHIDLIPGKYAIMF